MTFAEAKKLLREKFSGACLGLHAELWSTIITDEVVTYTVTIKIDGDIERHFQGPNLEEAVWKALRGIKIQPVDDALPEPKAISEGPVYNVPCPESTAVEVPKEELRAALINHCRASAEQTKALGLMVEENQKMGLYDPPFDNPLVKKD